MNFLLSILGRITASFERNIWRILTFIFAYALVTSVLTRNIQLQLFQQNANDGHAMDGFLVRSDKGYDFYDFSPMNYDLGTSDLRENTSFDPNANFVLTPVSLSQVFTSGNADSANMPQIGVAGPDALLVRDGGQISIFSPQEGKHYPLMPDDGVRSITTTSNNGIIYTTLDDRTLELHYLLQCKEPARILLNAVDGNASPTPTDALPSQNTILVSPSGNHVLVLDHSFDGHVWLVNLTSGEMERLNAAEFGDEQIHFSPVFIDARTIAFSVWGNGRGATYTYNVNNKKYDVISDAFSDEIRLSMKGEIVLIQSHSPMAGNLPFGSMPLFQQNATVERSVIEQIFGEDASWQSFFTDPSGSRLRFAADAKGRFSQLQDLQKRVQLTKLWSDIFDPFIQKENELKMITLHANGQTQTSGLLYFTNAEHPFFHWEDITLLLQTLQIPQNITDTYIRQLQSKSSNGEKYTLQEIH